MEVFTFVVHLVDEIDEAWDNKKWEAFHRLNPLFMVGLVFIGANHIQDFLC